MCIRDRFSSYLALGGESLVMIYQLSHHIGDSAMNNMYVHSCLLYTSTDTQHSITPAVFKTHGSIQFAGVTCKQHHLDTSFRSDIHQT